MPRAYGLSFDLDPSAQFSNFSSLPPQFGRVYVAPGEAIRVRADGTCSVLMNGYFD